MAEAKKTTTKTAKKAAKAEKPTAEVAEETILDTATVTQEIQDGNNQEDSRAESQGTEQGKVAKAGKRSAKALEEAAEKQAKEERKASTDDEAEKPKQHSNPTRSRLERRGKGFRKSAEAVEAGKAYSLEEGVAVAKKTSPVKFDASVELHVNLAVDPRQADQNIRDTLVLPAGSGKNVRVAVLTEDETTAKQAGADIAGVDDLLKQLDKGTLNFDVLVATPALMARLGKYARVLGPRGLMPNPKSGTVTNDIAKAVSEAKAGKVEYRVDSTGIIHLSVGKVSFSDQQLLSNVQAVIASLKTNKPASVKSGYFKAAHLATSMGPSITIDLASIN